MIVLCFRSVRSMLYLQKVAVFFVMSHDTDIFVNLHYYLQNAWHGLNLYLLRRDDFKVTKQCSKKDNILYSCYWAKSNLVRSLPAGHALTGHCFISMHKVAMLKALKQ